MCPTEAYSSLKPRFVLQGEKRKLSASPCPPASAACAHSHSGVMLIDKAFGILCPCGSHSGRDFCGDARRVVAVSLRLLPDVYGTQPNQVHAIVVVTWSSCQLSDALQLAVGSYPLSFPVCCNW